MIDNLPNNDGVLVVEGIQDETIQNLYAILRVNERERAILSDEIDDVINKLNLLKSRMNVLLSEREITNKRMWGRVYDVYPELKDLGRLEIKDDRSGVYIVEKPPSGPTFFSFPPFKK